MKNIIDTVKDKKANDMSSGKARVPCPVCYKINTVTFYLVNKCVSLNMACEKCKSYIASSALLSFSEEVKAAV